MAVSARAALIEAWCKVAPKRLVNAFDFSTIAPRKKKHA
jgi:hypothetical protein